MAAREVCCSEVRAPEVWNSRRREGSMRATLPRPQEAQMLAALADQAVVKLSLGPTWVQSEHGWGLFQPDPRAEGVGGTHGSSSMVHSP